VTVFRHPRKRKQRIRILLTFRYSTVVYQSLVPKRIERIIIVREHVQLYYIMFMLMTTTTKDIILFPCCAASLLGGYVRTTSCSLYHNRCPPIKSWPRYR
jgi:hypothetical protein